MYVRQRQSHEYIMPRSLFFNNLKHYFYISVSLGAFDWLIFLFWLFNKKCCRVWIGTDVLKVQRIWHYRWRARLCALFSEQVTVAPWLTSSLMEWGIRAQTVRHIADLDILKYYYPEGIKKNNRKKLNVLYYQPEGSIRNIDLDWRYGRDIVQRLADNFSDNFNFIICDGNKKREEVFHYVDVLLRPVRWDGEAIMVQEAGALGISVIWSYETGKYVEPDAHEIALRLFEIAKIDIKRDLKTELRVYANML